MSIKGNTFINLAGATAPMFISLMVVPLYLRLVGEARFGILVLVWLFVGYFEFFDFGGNSVFQRDRFQFHTEPLSFRKTFVCFAE